MRRRTRVLDTWCSLLVIATLLAACGRTVRVTVIDAETRRPMPDVLVLHERGEIRWLFLYPYRMPILKGKATTDRHGVAELEGVRDGDILTPLRFEGGPGVRIERIWYSPVLPVDETQSGPDHELRALYRELNRGASGKPLPLYLPVRRERKDAER